jgi:hypothetical protein
MQQKTLLDDFRNTSSPSAFRFRLLFSERLNE